MDKIVPVDNGAEAFVELLNSNGVKYIFLNPGTDTYCVQEALSKGALHNAQRGRVGVVLCSGKVPINIDEGRFNQVHWLQDQFDQAGVVRGSQDQLSEKISEVHLPDVSKFPAAAPCGIDAGLLREIRVGLQ